LNQLILIYFLLPLGRLKNLEMRGGLGERKNVPTDYGIEMFLKILYIFEKQKFTHLYIYIFSKNKSSLQNVDQTECFKVFQIILKFFNFRDDLFIWISKDEDSIFTIPVYETCFPSLCIFNEKEWISMYPWLYY